MCFKRRAKRLAAAAVLLGIAVCVPAVSEFRTHALASGAQPVNGSHLTTLVAPVTTESSAPANVAQPQAPPTEVLASQGYYVRGIDPIDGRLLVIDDADGVLRQSSDWGLTWSGNKGLPIGVTFRNVSKIVRFGNYLYLLATSSAGFARVWRAPPAASNTHFAWSPPLLTLTRGSTVIMTDLEGSSWGANDYLFCGEYGDPMGGPSIWRISLADANGAGTHCTRSWGPAPHDRHIHAVAPDPYRPGTVWAAIGDGGPQTIIRSTNYGASWSVVIADYVWQGVQISFSPAFVYIASDQPRFAYYVISRATLRPRVASPTRLAALRIPEMPGAHYYAIAYFGSVDPATGIYYCVANDTSSSGNWMGMFFALKVGSPLRVLVKGGHAISMNGEVFIAHGAIFSGVWHVPLLKRS